MTRPGTGGVACASRNSSRLSSACPVNAVERRPPPHPMTTQITDTASASTAPAATPGTAPLRGGNRSVLPLAAPGFSLTPQWSHWIHNSNNNNNNSQYPPTLEPILAPQPWYRLPGRFPRSIHWPPTLVSSSERASGSFAARRSCARRCCGSRPRGIRPQCW